MRTHVAKSINTRCKAIENAVKAYNLAARDVDPPRPTLDWVKASHYNFLEDFELLRDTRQDITSKPWATPVVRVAMKQAQKIKRAHEEIRQCNIEVRRLHTHIIDEDSDLLEAVAHLQSQDDPIARAATDYTTRRRRVNVQLLYRIHQIYDIDGFSGNPAKGTRIGRASEQPPHEALVNVSGIYRSSGDSEDDNDDLDGEEERQYGGLINFISDMPLSR